MLLPMLKPKSQSAMEFIVLASFMVLVILGFFAATGSRVFAMPQTVNGINYSIQIIDNREMVANYLGYEHIKFLPSNVTGSIVKGNNKISKANDLIFLN